MHDLAHNNFDLETLLDQITYLKKWVTYCSYGSKHILSNFLCFLKVMTTYFCEVWL